MFKTTISILLLLLTVNTYSDNSNQGIDLNEVMRLLESTPVKQQTPQKAPYPVK